jgi:DNA-binding NarL/FixJ family response regulator
LTKEAAQKLTRREVEILNLLGRGLNTRGIAKSLGITYYTVRKHRSNILSKLELHDAAELVVYAVNLALKSVVKHPNLKRAGIGSVHANNRYR